MLLLTLWLGAAFPCALAFAPFTPAASRHTGYYSVAEKQLQTNQNTAALLAGSTDADQHSVVHTHVPGVALQKGASRGTAALSDALQELEELCGFSASSVGTAESAHSQTVLLSTHWLLRQIDPETYKASGLQPRTQALLEAYNTPMAPVGECNKAILQGSLDAMDVWYYTTVAGNQSLSPSKRPGGEWLRCFADQLHHVPLGQPKARFENYVVGMELQHLMRDDKALQRRKFRRQHLEDHEVAHSGSASLLRSESEAVSLSALQLRSLNDWSAEAIDQAARHFTTDRCHKELVLCGYYLTHRLMSLSSFVTKPAKLEKTSAAVILAGDAADQDEHRAKLDAVDRMMLAKRTEGMLRREVVPSLAWHHRRKASARIDGLVDQQDIMDLASQVVFILRHVVGAKEADNDVKSLRRLLTDAPAPSTCREAGTRLLASTHLRAERRLS